MKWLPLAIPLVTAAVLSSTAAQAATPVQDATHAYGLNRTYADELGGAALVPVGGRLLAKRYRFEAGQGLTLSGALPTSHYSIEFRFTPADTSGYKRLIGFRASSPDNGLYLHNGAIEFYPITSEAAGALAAGRQADVAITRDAASRIVSLYVEGVLRASFEDTQDLAVFDTDVNGNSFGRFFIDDNGEDAAGTLNHLRVFDAVLSPAEVRKLANGKRPGNVTSE